MYHYTFAVFDQEEEARIIVRYTIQQTCSHLRARCVALEKENADLRAGAHLDKYQAKCEQAADARNIELARTVKTQEQTIQKLSKQLETSQTKLDRMVSIREELRAQIKEIKSALGEAERKNRELTSSVQQKGQHILKLEKELKDRTDELDEANKQIELLQKQLQAAGNENGKMATILGRNSRNSGIPTSRNRVGAKKPVVNSRKPTGKSPGGQNGHPHHPRVAVELPQAGTAFVYGISDPLWRDPEYEFVGYVPKRLLTPVMVVKEDLYYVPRFRNIRTGAHLNASCPDWLKDDVNYSPEYKAQLLYLNLYANLGMNKCKITFDFLTSGRNAPSTGFVNNLVIDFAEKTEALRAASYAKMLGAHCMNVDGTVIKVGGKQYNVMICVSGPCTLYFFRPRKGHAGVKETPIEHTTAILVCDHEATFHSYGSGHQECLDHVERYLISSIENEKELAWNVKMLAFIRQLRHEANEIDREREANGDVRNEGEVRARFSKEMFDSALNQFRDILLPALNGEYKDNLPNAWFPDGKNLCKRMLEHPEEYLLFLQDDQVDCSNSEAERRARTIKRKQAACTEFRGLLGVVAQCECRSVIDTLLVSGTSGTAFSSIVDLYRKDTTDSDRLRMMQTAKPLFEQVVEMDANVIRTCTKQLAEAEKVLSEADEELKKAQADYDAKKAKRIDTLGEESDPSDEEKDALTKLNHWINAQYAAKAAVDKTRTTLTFNEKHKARLEAQLKANKEKIQSLTDRITAADAREKAEEGRDKHLVENPNFLFPNADMSPELQAALAKTRECEAAFNLASAELQSITSSIGKAALEANNLSESIDPKTGKPVYVYGSSPLITDEELHDRINQAYANVTQAAENYGKAQKELEALVKKINKRAYKKRKKRSPTPDQQNDAEEEVVEQA